MRKVVGTVGVLAVGLACSACGAGLLLNGVASGSSSVTAVTTIERPLPAVPLAHRLPIRRSGAGSESLGIFATHGWLYVKATCVGAGRFGIRFAAVSSKNAMTAHPACLNSRRTVKFSSNIGVTVHRTRISVRAPVGMKWTIIVFEGPPDMGPGTLNVW
jgi:hypothetical protein